MFIRFLLRKIRKRKNASFITTDESENVVAGMAKAKILYKELITKAHPDKNVQNIELAEELTRSINMNRYNYSKLLEIKKIIDQKLKH